MNFPHVRIYQLALRTFTPEGTLRAASKLLRHIRGCGFTHVQLTPVVESDNNPNRDHWSKRQRASGMENPKNPYILKDYYDIDPEYGTADDLSFFVHEAHAAGLKVMLDLVYYHCGRNATLVTEHPAWMLRDADGNVHIGEWNTPSPDYANPELCTYMWENMEYFIRTFDIDGYRCDVGDLVPIGFWKEGIRRCRALKPDFFMLNEGRSIAWLSEFDCNYFYPCCFDSVKISQGTMRASDYQQAWQAWRSQLPDGKACLHFLDNHDVCSDSFDQRMEKVLGNEAMEVQNVLIYTLDGIPFVFNGNEIADDRKHSLFSSRFHGRDDTLPWENVLCENGQRRMEVMKNLNALRDAYEALNSPDLCWLDHDCQDAVLAYVRPGPEQVLVVLNLRDAPVEVHLEKQPDWLKPVLQHMAKYRLDTDGFSVQLLGYGYLVAVF